ncbi:MAG: HAMP domain-containing sensor histidine kinase, partial [Chloroflexota bacterium]|nr:HAMP domain-containing sensor histidine kinase [Chloroflexota bacterium]
ILATSLLAAGILYLVFDRLVTQRLSRLGKLAHALSLGDYSARAAVEGKDEVDTLGRSFNEMAQRLGEVEKLKSEFLAMVSHDLKTPLGLIRNAAEIMQDSEEPHGRDLQHKLASSIIQNVDRTGSLVDDLLDLARLEAGQAELERQPVEVPLTIQESVSAATPLLMQKGHSLELELPATLSPVLADPARLKQILLNLLYNAIRFTPEGGRITLRAQEDTTLTTIEVADNGPGIPQEVQSRLFERFYRWGPQGGAGLGLAITKQLVELHGGHIWVRSAPGKGSAFSFTLPKVGQNEDTGRG